MRTCLFILPRLHLPPVAFLCLVLVFGVGDTQTRFAARNFASSSTPALDQGRSGELPAVADGDDDGDLQPPDSAGWPCLGTFGHDSAGAAAVSILARLDGANTRLSGHLVMRA